MTKTQKIEKFLQRDVTVYAEENWRGDYHLETIGTYGRAYIETVSKTTLKKLMKKYNNIKKVEE